MRILVIEDHALVREGMLLALQMLAEEGEPVEVLGAQHADAATELLARNDDFDLAVLDLMLPGTSGMAYLGVLRKRYPHIPVVVVSALDDAATAFKAVRQGASGFISKATPTDALLRALRQVLEGEIWLPPEYRNMGSRRQPKTVAARFGLTAAQARVLELLTEGKTNREIADLLGVAEGTVKIHVSAIFKAMNVGNRSQALLVAQGRK